MVMEMESASVRGEPARMWQIVVVASIAAGVQFGWALQLSLLTPYVQTLGVPHAYATFVWLCGPISGLIVQPVVGHFSDHCTSRIGRRRPFILGGAFFVIIAVILISMAKDIGHKAGDTLEQHTKPRAVAVFVTGFWILDVSNNMLQGPTRAFLADLSAGDHSKMRISNAYFSFFMAVGNVLGYAAGSFKNLYKAFPSTRTVACNESCANLKSCFILDIILLVIVVGAASVAVGEKRHTEDDKADDGGESLNFLSQLTGSFRTMKKPMWILLLVTCTNWIAWFPFLLYDTDWMGREVYGGSPDNGSRAQELYDRGVRAGSLGLMLNSVVLGFSSLGVEPAGRRTGGPKFLWGLVNVLLGASLACTVWVSRAASAWRGTQTGQLPSPPFSVKSGALAIFSVLGIPLSVTYSIPFALASIYCAESGGGQGLSLGVVNLSIVIPQMIVSVISGPLDNAFGGGNLPAFVMGAIAAVISGALAIFVLPNPPPQAQPQFIAAGGGH